MIFKRILYLSFVLHAAGISAAQQKTIIRSFEFPPPVVTGLPDNTCRVEMENCRPDDIPAKPALPLFSTAIEIPEGYFVEKITLIESDTITLPLTGPVTHAQPYFRPGDLPRTVERDPFIYQTDSIYPEDQRLTWRTDPSGDATLASVIFTPLQYNPVGKVLFYHDKITLNISLSGLANEMPAVQVPILSKTLPGLNPADRCDYLIISTSNLIDRASPPWDFKALLNQREHSGFITKILPVEWIYANYGGADQPEQIRHFLQDAYESWDLKYLLIAGTHSMIPSRLLHIEIDGLFDDYIENIPADHVYYGCMTGSYDGNSNGLYGEYNDGDGGGDVDLTAEILVGRFPVENEIELSHMVRKTLQYDLAGKQEFINNGFVSEKLFDYDPVIYGKPFMEEIRNGSTTYGRNTLGYTTSPYALDFITINNLHDTSSFIFNSSDILNYFTNRLHSVNHLGHGSYFQCFKLNCSTEPAKSAIAALDNPFPWAVYSQACLSGAFDKLNCFAEHLVTVSNAASTVVMNSRNGWISTTGVYGHSHYFHRAFWDSAFRGQATTFGEMNEAQRRANLGSVPSYGPSLWRWVYYELNLFGDPALPVMPSMLNVPPTFTHEPAQNTYNTLSNYVISCKLDPIGIYDPESPYAIWKSSADGIIVTQKMVRLSANSYQLEIPPQPVYSVIDYLIGASNRAGYAASEPESGVYAFSVTEELNLLIAGSPANAGTVTPGYGSYSSASGMVINASAVDTFYETEATRFTNQGFFGTGSVPPESSDQSVSFRIDVDSILVWRWQKEYRTLINSSIAIPQDSTYWLEDSTVFTPPPAELYITDPETNLFAFAGWTLDGIRSPALPEKSVLQHPAITSDTPHELTALYIPAGQDSDGNGIEDWWEYQYFGSTAQNIYADFDNDGYDNYEEFKDHSDPLDPLTVPSAPLINHDPLSSPADHPGPFSINALITDTHSVTNAAVSWRINSAPWQRTPMEYISSNNYSCVIADETSPGDMIRYKIEADDPSGNHASTPEYSVFLTYPVADYSLLEDILIVSKPDTMVITNNSYIINRGNTPLNWSLSFGFKEQFLSGSLDKLLNWNISSIEQPWVISTNRSYSVPYSIHATLISTRGTPHYASITLPPLVIGNKAVLSFYHWMDGEIDMYGTPGRGYDGGIIEFSTDGGVSFQQLSGPYTHTVYGWDMSPWPDGTPCFSGLSGGWRKIEIDLVQYHPETLGFEGQTVMFRFVYGGDDNTDHEGWYIDDIRISPSAPPAGFTYFLPDIDPMTTAPGSYSELICRTLPGLLDSRTEYTTVFLDSNAPTNAAFSFLWQALIRENPLILGFNAEQLPIGNGDVNLTMSTREKDNEPLDLKLEWSDNRGHNWYSTELTDVQILPQQQGISYDAPDGLITDIQGTTNSIPVTNSVSAIWNSATPETDISWISNVYMRLTVSSPWFTSSETRIFPVDNVAPVFNPGTASVSPISEGGDYVVSSNNVIFEWPAAEDIPETNSVSYQIATGTNILADCTDILQVSVSMSNRLDRESIITITPVDPAGNRGEPIELAILILDPDNDYDNDGTSNGDEEKAGTDATDSQSLFIITSFNSSTEGAFTIRWQSVTNRKYTVETSGTLSAPAWSPSPGLSSIPGTGGIMTVQVPHNGTNAFFRVKVEK